MYYRGVLTSFLGYNISSFLFFRWELVPNDFLLVVLHTIATIFATHSACSVVVFEFLMKSNLFQFILLPRMHHKLT